MRKILIVLLLCVVAYAWAVGFSLLAIRAIDHSLQLPLLDSDIVYLRLDEVNVKESLESFDYVVAGQKRRCAVVTEIGRQSASLVCECPWDGSHRSIDRCREALHQQGWVPDASWSEMTWGDRGEGELLRSSSDVLLRALTGIGTVILLFLVPAWRLVEWRKELRQLITRRYWYGLAGCLAVLSVGAVFSYGLAIEKECLSALRALEAKEEMATTSERDLPVLVIWLSAFSAFLVLAFFEELVFRGFLFARLLALLGVRGAIFVSGLVFMAGHISMAFPFFLGEVLEMPGVCEMWPVYRALFPLLAGLIFGWWFWRFGSILLVTLAHALWNFPLAHLHAAALGNLLT